MDLRISSFLLIITVVLCVDVTIVNSLCDIAEASKTPGYHSERAALLKRDKYERRCNGKNLLFTPFAMESIGGFGKECYELMDRIGARLAEIQDAPRKE